MTSIQKLPTVLGLLFALSLWHIDCCAQVTSNVLLRTRLIRAGAGYGTAFSLDVDGRQYLVTAKHVVGALNTEDVIYIYKNDSWASVSVKVLKCADPIDIAVLILPDQETVDYPLPTPAPSVEFFIGQDAYIVGYPYGLASTGKVTSGPVPIPFLKKAIISAMAYLGEGHVLYLDGHNNPGFSGGPVVYRDLNRGAIEFRVAGVVSGFRHDYDPALRLEQVKPNEENSVPSDRLINYRGKQYRLIDTDLLVRSNTGIIVSYDIQHAIDLIRKNPIGPKIEGAK